MLRCCNTGGIGRTEHILEPTEESSNGRASTVMRGLEPHQAGTVVASMKPQTLEYVMLGFAAAFLLVLVAGILSGH